MAFLIILYLFLYLRTSLLNHWHLGSYYFDLGIIHQTVYNTSRGRFFELTDPYGIRQISRFSIHFDPIIAIFSPFYLFFPYAEVLIIGEIVVVVFSFLPLILLINHFFKKQKFLFRYGITTIILFSFFNYYPLSNLLTKNFHAVSLAIPLFFWAIYFFEKEKFLLSTACLFLITLCKETLFLTIFALIFYYQIIRKKKLPKFVFLPLIFSFLVLIFYLHPQKNNRFIGYFEKSLLYLITTFFSKKTLFYLKNLLFPLGFLPLLNPAFLIAFPEISLNVLAKNTNLVSLNYHYEALIIPFLFFSLILFFKKITSNKKLTLGLIIYLAFFNFLFLKKNRIYFFKGYNNKKKLAVVKYWQKKLGNDQIRVSTSGHLAPYFSGRRYFYNFLFDFAYENFNLTKEDIKNQVKYYQFADYVIVNKEELENSHPLVEFYKNHLFQNKKFKLLFEKEGILVFKKIN